MLPLIMAACGAAGAVAGVVTTCAAKEQDKQAIKRYEKVNAELINSRVKLQQRYYELADRSKQQINELNLKLAESEMEKDVVYLALELYQELMGLRENIDIHPSFEVLVEFHKAIVLTNYVLKQLDRRLVPVNQDYFSRTLTRIDERDDLSKEQLFSFMAVLMNPQQDTVSSLLGEVQNEMFSQPTIEVEAKPSHNFNEDLIELEHIDLIELDHILEEDEAKSSVTQIGTIKCPKCGMKNHVDKNASETNCTYCDYRICLIYRTDEIIWEEVSQIQNEILPEQSAIEKEKTISSIFDEVKDWGERGEKLFDLDYYEEALACLKKAVDADSDNDEYWNMQARILYLLDRDEEALESLEKAININPGNDQLWRRKGVLLNRLNRKEEALESLEEAINFNQQDVKHWYFQSEILWSMDRNAEALQSLIKAININPEDEQLWCLKGKIYLSLENNENALKSLEKTISINSDNDEAWYWQSKALYRLGKINEAIVSVNKAIALESNDDRYYFLQSCVLDELNLNTESLTSIDKAIEIDPEDSLYWYTKSEILFGLEEYKKALFSINRAINLDSKDSDYWSQKSFVTLNLQKYGDSLTCADKAIALNPTNDWYWYQKSRALYLLDREKEAFKALDQAIAIDPDNETYRNFRDEMVEYLTNKTEESTGIVDNVLDKVFSFFD